MENSMKKELVNFLHGYVKKSDAEKTVVMYIKQHEWGICKYKWPTYTNAHCGTINSILDGAKTKAAIMKKVNIILEEYL